jgi:hypothetical protein
LLIAAVNGRYPGTGVDAQLGQAALRVGVGVGVGACRFGPS